MKALRILLIGALLAVAGAVAGFASSFLVTPVYVSSCRLVLKMNPSNHQFLRDKVSDVTQVVTSRSSCAKVLDAASLPDWPERPHRDVFEWCGSAVGLLGQLAMTGLGRLGRA